MSQILKYHNLKRGETSTNSEKKKTTGYGLVKKMGEVGNFYDISSLKAIRSNSIYTGATVK